MATSPALLAELRAYPGCGEAIRQAISNPGRATEEAAWTVVCPAVAKLRDFYEFSTKIEYLFPRILQYLGTGDVPDNFEKNQATAKKLAELIDFANQFDNLKMSNPNIQNDFSYYRRTVSRMRMNSTQSQSSGVVSDDVANKMSLFFAHANPVTKAIIDSTNVAIQTVCIFIEKQGTDVLACTVSTSDFDRSRFSRQSTSVFDILTKALSHSGGRDRHSVYLGSIFKLTLLRHRTTQSESAAFFLRVLVVSAVLYDHVDTTGVFAKTSKINIRSSVKLIQAHGGSNSDALLNALRYSTVHLNDESTPKNVKQVLA
eukprot:jgi/Hompol1/2888/HPOL_005872-RA